MLDGILTNHGMAKSLIIKGSRKIKRWGMVVGGRGGGGGGEGIQRMINVPKQRDSSLGIESTKKGNHQS